MRKLSCPNSSIALCWGIPTWLCISRSVLLQFRFLNPRNTNTSAINTLRDNTPWIGRVFTTKIFVFILEIQFGALSLHLVISIVTNTDTCLNVKLLLPVCACPTKRVIGPMLALKKMSFLNSNKPIEPRTIYIDWHWAVSFRLPHHLSTLLSWGIYQSMGGGVIGAFIYNSRSRHLIVVGEFWNVGGGPCCSKLFYFTKGNYLLLQFDIS